MSDDAQRGSSPDGLFGRARAAHAAESSRSCTADLRVARECGHASPPGTVREATDWIFDAGDRPFESSHMDGVRQADGLQPYDAHCRTLPFVLPGGSMTTATRLLAVAVFRLRWMGRMASRQSASPTCATAACRGRSASRSSWTWCITRRRAAFASRSRRRERNRSGRDRRLPDSRPPRA